MILRSSTNSFRNIYFIYLSNQLIIINILEITISDNQNICEDTIGGSVSADKLRNLIDEIRLQSPGKIIPLQVIINLEGSLEIQKFLHKLIQDKVQAPGLNISYYDFYNSHLKGISRFF